MSPRTRKVRPVIVVAGESDYDRQVLQSLVPALHPRNCPRVVMIKDPIRLAPAKDRLTPRIEQIRNRATARAALSDAELAGIVVHVDPDHVADGKYDLARKRIETEMERGFRCPFALALAAAETEAWLMQFPDAFLAVSSGWKLDPKFSQCDLALEHNPKKKLRDHKWKPVYSESAAPKIKATEAVVEPKPGFRRERSMMNSLTEALLPNAPAESLERIPLPED